MSGRPVVERLVSPHRFDGRGPVPEEVQTAARTIAALRSEFLVHGSISEAKTERLFQAAAIQAEWIRELHEAVHEDTLAGQVRKLRPVAGDVIVVRLDADSPLPNGIAGDVTPGVLFLILGPGDTVETFDEEQMAAAGWFRRAGDEWTVVEDDGRPVWDGLPPCGTREEAEDRRGQYVEKHPQRQRHARVALRLVGEWGGI